MLFYGSHHAVPRAHRLASIEDGANMCGAKHRGQQLDFAHKF
jgi:hypothetical protein